MVEDNFNDSDKHNFETVKILCQKWIKNQYGRTIDPQDITIDSNRGRLILVNVEEVTTSAGLTSIRYSPVNYEELDTYSK